MTRNEMLKIAYGSSQMKQLEKDFVSDAKRIKTLAQLSDFIGKWGMMIYYETKISTLKNRLTDIKRWLRNAEISEDNPIYRAFSIPSEIYTNLNNAYSEKVQEKLMSDEVSNIDYILLVENTIAELSTNIQNNVTKSLSNNASESRELAYQKLILLSLTTGRRQIEILKTISISKKKELAKYDGLAKKEDNNGSIVAPILIDSRIAQKYLKEIREEFNTAEMTNQDINRKYNASIGKAISRYTNFEEFKFTRTAYAEYCFEKFGGNADKSAYFAQILGHELKIKASDAYVADGK